MPTVDDFLDHLGGYELLAWHRENGRHRSEAVYLDLYREQLARGLSETRLIYLDTNYWVRLRDAALGKGTPEAVQLLQILRAMVRSREALCVSQLYSLLEICKQEENSLRASAELLDELTEGVAIASPEDVLLWECAEFAGTTLRRNCPVNSFPWTKVGQIHDSGLPSTTPGFISPAQRAVLLKALIDATWNMTFSYVFQQFDWDTKSRLSFEFEPELFVQLTASKAERQARGVTLNSARSEAFADLFSSQAMPLLKQLSQLWRSESTNTENKADLLLDVATIQSTALKAFEERSLGKSLPGLAIHSDLYALYETDRQRRKPQTTNDWFDSCHAAVALPYCDLFLTERHLAHRLCHLLHADVEYECEVIGTIGESVDRLRAAS